jgi:UPF0176 protein
MTVVVATFYQFVSLPDYRQLRSPLLSCCQHQGVKGTILLAAEGINATIAGTQTEIDAVMRYLRSDERFADLEYRQSLAATPPFERLKVKLKREIVTLGVADIDPNQQVGTYVTPQQWNALLADPDVVLVDTRNAYEVEIGTFKGAQNPKTESFREFPAYVRQNLTPNQHKKVAMFCTGGIRCEKATSYLLKQGFERVYHLKGGILQYLAEIPPEESLWEGECFVFDERVAVKSGLEPGSYEMCVGCGYPLADADKAAPQYEEGVSCPHCYESLTPEKRSRLLEKRSQKQMQA